MYEVVCKLRKLAKINIGYKKNNALRVYLCDDGLRKGNYDPFG